ncbi:MAG TPA: bifunctional DNA primase/polymerase [Verrucomicrobiae bacterium]|nr:bifunctional DNA primase/polymerase [Verrucomicrobiae bacterium]
MSAFRVSAVAREFLRLTEPAAPTPRQLTPFQQRAKILIDRGIPIIPLLPRSKAPCTAHAAYDASSNPDQIAKWAKLYSPDSNVGAVARFDGFWKLDDDAGTLASRYKADTGQDLPITFTVKTARGYHYYFLHDEASRLVRYDGHENSGVIAIPGYKGEARCNNQYVVGPMSVHPSGALYEICNDAPIVAASVQLLEWLQKAFALSESRKPENQKAKDDDNGKLEPGFRKLFDAVGYRPLVKRINNLENVSLHISDLELGEVVPCPMPHHRHADYSNCFGPLKDAPEVLHCLGNCQWSGDMVAACRELDGGKAKYRTMYDCARAICKEERLKFEDFFPSKPAEQSTKLLHPKLSDDALYGLAGDIVKMIEPQTESHPAGLLAQILLYFGNVLGHTAYFQIESTRHYGNLFIVRVGISSRARKGTGGDRINALFEQVDPVWFRTRLRSGLSSSEGLIVAVGDEELSEDRDGHPVVLHGEVHDKRLVSYEGEFSQVLVVMQRAGNTISTNLRNAWDGKPLRTMTIKPRCATNHTISILGDITGTELKSRMSANDSVNGFGNRFLWVHVERTKLLPFGGEEIDFSPYVEKLKHAIEFGQSQNRVFMDENARKMWSRAYTHSFEDRGGLFGAVTSRGEAQVLRLSLIYAMLDRSGHIRSEHLRAALAFWRYCEDSARFIFEELTDNQQLIIEFARERSGATKTDFLKVLFGRHRSATDIAADLEQLLRLGRLISSKNKRGVTVYFSQGRTTCPVLPKSEET